MDSKIFYRIEELALLIEKFRALDGKDQEWLRDLFKGDRTIISCLEILDLIENKSLSYYELANIMGCSPETVKQKLNAMISGGIAINQSRRKYKAPRGGRPRKLCNKPSDTKVSVL
ncbi:MAG: hypothetical protein KME29_04945 [Calothrix sp. FI2-JRJ7]|jgi:biotin operon repressor|nr:hypothetical protein [Calothrix sp. FI2-JRJ7]